MSGELFVTSSATRATGQRGPWSKCRVCDEPLNFAKEQFGGMDTGPGFQHVPDPAQGYSRQREHAPDPEPITEESRVVMAGVCDFCCAEPPEVIFYTHSDLAAVTQRRIAEQPSEWQRVHAGPRSGREVKVSTGSHVDTEIANRYSPGWLACRGCAALAVDERSHSRLVTRIKAGQSRRFGRSATRASVAEICREFANDLAVGPLPKLPDGSVPPIPPAGGTEAADGAAS